MSTLRKLTKYLTQKGNLKTLVLTHWKPKLICLVLAIAVWLWMEFRYVQQSDDWEGGNLIFSVPEADF